ncbi:hypothetical protein [Streptomyces fungicidicus]|uniref:hypothetical protein n=1 Tax=Streptomyces fungicidicus TaxID=68203 RepID=UPI0036A70905
MQMIAANVRCSLSSAIYELAGAIQPLAVFAEQGPDGRVFIGAKKATPRRNDFGKLWRKACDQVGIKGLHFHDLRHAGDTLAAATGASTRELMTRMGNNMARAALIFSTRRPSENG